MKKLISAFAILLGCALAAWAEPPAPITTLRAFRTLTNAEAGRGLPVAFEATVTYYKRDDRILFLQDGSAGTYVWQEAGIPAAMAPGDRVLVRGRTEANFRPNVISDSVTVLRHGELPKPVPATFDQLIHNQFDSILVTARGVVRSADKANTRPRNDTADLRVLAEGGYIWVTADHYAAEMRQDLLDAEVEVTGVAAGEFDGKIQSHGVHLHVSSPADIKILSRADASPWSLPVTPMNEVMSGYHITDRTRRYRVHGTITYYQPGSAVVLQDGAKSLWISTRTLDPLQVGDVVDATGFPEAHNGFLALTRGEVLDSHIRSPIAALPASRKELSTSKHVIDLVSIEGEVLSAARGAAQDQYGLIANGELFSAIYRHPPGSEPLPPMKRIPIGARVRVSGICITEDSNPFQDQAPFDILMRSYDDIEVVGNPSPVNTRNLMILVGLLLAVVLAVSARGWSIERRVRRQMAALARLEQGRSRILEDINGARPLPEIVQEIAALASGKLDGAPCWCQLAEGPCVGQCPEETKHLRIVREQIPARSGPPLGAVFAAFDPLAKPRAGETEALAMAAGLATLAIETRGLYSELRHRSEFDLLTGIHNRFSFDKHLESLIQESRHQGRSFGLIYIDLDEFKQVNDVCGHQVGDIYLQQAALRMKQQVRPHDLLARLGGD